MQRFFIEAGLTMYCKCCGKQSTIPALKVDQGVKCKYCGAAFQITVRELVAKAVMLAVAAKRNDVDVG